MFSFQLIISYCFHHTHSTFDSDSGFFGLSLSVSYHDSIFYCFEIYDKVKCTFSFWMEKLSWRQAMIEIRIQHFNVIIQLIAITKHMYHCIQANRNASTKLLCAILSVKVTDGVVYKSHTVACVMQFRAFDQCFVLESRIRIARTIHAKPRLPSSRQWSR